MLACHTLGTTFEQGILGAVLCICCSITNHHKTQWLKTMAMYYFLQFYGLARNSSVGCPGLAHGTTFSWRTDWGLGSAGKAVNTGPLIPHGLSFSRRPNLASSCRDGKCSRGLKGGCQALSGQLTITSALFHWSENITRLSQIPGLKK